MDNFLALINQVAEKRSVGYLQWARAVVTATYPDGTIDVTYQPEGIPGYGINYAAGWAGTPKTASGAQGGISKGTIVLVISFDEQKDDQIAIASSFAADNQSPGAPEDEYWIVHKTPQNCVKLQNNGATVIGGANSVQHIAPVVALTTGGGTLDGTHAMVRKSDLDAVIGELNAVRTFLVGFGYGAGVVPFPQQSGSSVGRAQ